MFQRCGVAVNCIEEIEASARKILLEIFDIFLSDRTDDSEYIRNVKAVLSGIDNFIQDNEKYKSLRESINETLYQYARSLWLNHIQREDVTETDRSSETDNEGYDEYYYDYIYKHGVYPR